MRPRSTPATTTATAKPIRANPIRHGPNPRLVAVGVVCLIDHLIRPQQQRGRDGEAEGLRGLDIDHEFELSRLFDRGACQ